MAEDVHHDAATCNSTIPSPGPNPSTGLLTGETVLRCVFDLVQRLRATGHTITVDGDGAPVRIEPRVHENAWVTWDTNWADVEAVLDAESDRAVPLQHGYVVVH